MKKLSLFLFLGLLSARGGFCDDNRQQLAQKDTDRILNQTIVDYSNGKKWVFRGELSLHEFATSSVTSGAVVGRRDTDGAGIGAINRAIKTPEGSSLGIYIDLFQQNGNPDMILYKFGGPVVGGAVNLPSKLIDDLATHLSTTDKKKTIDSIRFHDLVASAEGAPQYGTATGELHALMPWSITLQDLIDTEEATDINSFHVAMKEGRLKDMGDFEVLTERPASLPTRHWREIAQPDECPSEPIRECWETFSYTSKIMIPKVSIGESKGEVTDLGPLQVQCECTRARAF